MKIKNLTIFIIAFGITGMLSSFISQNQQTPASLIVGIWKLSEVQIAGMPELTGEQKMKFDKEMKTAKDSSSLDIKANGTFHNVTWAGKKYHTDGKWKLISSGKKLLITENESTNADTINIASLTATKMVWEAEGSKIVYTK
jgi:hypothetical protein